MATKSPFFGHYFSSWQYSLVKIPYSIVISTGNSAHFPGKVIKMRQLCNGYGLTEPNERVHNRKRIVAIDAWMGIGVPGSSRYGLLLFERPVNPGYDATEQASSARKSREQAYHLASPLHSVSQFSLEKAAVILL